MRKHFYFNLKYSSWYVGAIFPRKGSKNFCFCSRKTSAIIRGFFIDANDAVKVFKERFVEEGEEAQVRWVYEESATDKKATHLIFIEKD